MRIRWFAPRLSSAARFCEEKADRLYSIEIFWIVMIDGSYPEAGLLHALAQLPKAPAVAFSN